MGRNLLDNDGKHISAIIDQTHCEKHGASTGMACYVVTPDGNTGSRDLLGVCGARVKRAGYNGKISETSFQRTTGPREPRKNSYKKKEAA